MTKEFRRIPFNEFADNVVRVFKLVVRGHEAVIVENDEGEGVMLRPLDESTIKQPLTDDDYDAFRSAFGGWADVDTEKLKKEIYESRKSSRPPVEL